MGEERNHYFKNLGSHLSAEPLSTVQLGTRLVGEKQPVFVIAEVGANHRGDLNTALRAIDLAKEAGADAVKFQHLNAETMAADVAFQESWQGKEGWKSLREFYKASNFPYEWTEPLMAHAKKVGIMFLSTPFDAEAIRLLDELDIPAFKVASYELTSDQLLIEMAKTMRPIILSTGMAYLEEVAHAVRVIQAEGNPNIVLLHCSSLYPPRSPADLNLKAIETLKNAFKVPVGYSDHTDPKSFAASLGAVALGASVIERHVSDNQGGGSHDDQNAMSFERLKDFIQEIRFLEAALSGSGIKQPVVYPDHDHDEIYERWTRRSIFAAKAIKKGEVVTEDHLILLRPSDGLDPKFFPLLIGKVAMEDIAEGSPLSWNSFLSSDAAN
ncbi:MAG: N-acetylneuraminate synthase family protein [Patescibacteria group bacterium]